MAKARKAVTKSSTSNTLQVYARMLLLLLLYLQLLHGILNAKLAYRPILIDAYRQYMLWIEYNAVLPATNHAQ